MRRANGGCPPSRHRARAGLDAKDDATRKHGAVVLQRLAAAAPWFVGGSADLAGSAAPPHLKGRGIVGPGAGAGEDPFAGAQPPLRHSRARDGRDHQRHRSRRTFRPYCGTFLIFSDYMRPPDAARGADAACLPSSSSRTTRSSSAKTVRRTSRSSSSTRCARSRTSRSGDPPTGSRPRWRGLDRAHTRGAFAARAVAPDASGLEARGVVPARRRVCAAPTVCRIRGPARAWCSSLRAPRCRWLATRPGSCAPRARRGARRLDAVR